MDKTKTLLNCVQLLIENMDILGTEELLELSNAVNKELARNGFVIKTIGGI